MKPTHEQMMAGYKVACDYGVKEARAFDLAEKMYQAMASVGAAVGAEERLELAVDAAMAEMANITPPLRRSECKRLIRAALATFTVGAGAPTALKSSSDGIRHASATSIRRRRDERDG